MKPSARGIVEVQMNIEPATLADLEDLAALLRAQFAEHDISLDEQRIRAAICGPLDDPRLGTFLIARDEVPRGFAYFSYTWTLEHGGKSAWLEELYVVPSARSRGVGTSLLRTVITHARRAGCAAIDLEIDANHLRAGRLYEQEGFIWHRRSRCFLKLDG